MRKSTKLTLAALLITAALVGCSASNGDAENGKAENGNAEQNNGQVGEQAGGETGEQTGEQAGEQAENDADSGDLQSLQLQESGQTKLYHGYAEYGHNETLVEIKEEPEATIYVYEGVMNDGSGLTDENGEPFSFRRIVTVTADQIKSELQSDHMDRVATSLFQEKIWIEKPLQPNHSWTEKVTYQGAEYEAVSTILSAGQNDEGYAVYEVETIIANIEGFPDNTYKEKIKLEEGKGVTAFQSTMAQLTDPLDEDGYTFGYGLSAIQND
ncbi:hypothetical protein DUZ99_01670 [Xylanibacillus composti]|uniref:Lipoprotein n=1 Tax=Xylanibacillus composti TaxID=1572762 RepID=A0A8J4H7I4_9BACL|nr:hypothetical protein [Xylanibacillus composti]MDT9723707.1 hypothetical protein [Xylanibacillus composti]GIQ71426.1 hypothetical protein XYCOK13_42500 [Xylanibacillus composti]